MESSAAAAPPDVEKIGVHHAAPSRGEPRLRLEFLDGIRGFAALYVLFFHVYLMSDFPGRSLLTRMALAPFGFGHYAVSVFIVLSGFCLMMPVSRAGGAMRGGVLGFVKRRARRILPPYYAAFLISIPWSWIYYFKFHAGKASERAGEFAVSNLSAHAFLYHNLTKSWEFHNNGAFWSVATEWQIYFVFALLLLPVWRRFGGGVTAVIALALSLGPHYLLPTAHNMDCACFWYIALFALGMLGADALFSSRRKGWVERVPWGVLTVALAAGFCAVNFLAAPSHDPWQAPWVRNYTWITDFWVGIATITLIFFCANHSRPEKRNVLVNMLESRPALKLGAFSYSLYLVHESVLAPVEHVSRHLNCAAPLRLLFCWGISLPVAVGFSYLFYLVCERRFVNTPANAGRPARPVQGRTWIKPEQTLDGSRTI